MLGNIKVSPCAGQSQRDFKFQKSSKLTKKMTCPVSPVKG